MGASMAACEACGQQHTKADYERGRGGRPYNRVRHMLRKFGPHLCWICGDPINMYADKRAPESWTMDHVVPLSKAPCLALELTNLREAHRSCNSRKGARTEPPGRIHNTRDW